MSRKQPFIKKGEGQRFELVHRSMEDHSLEDNPSPYVLVPVESGNILKKEIKDSASAAGGGGGNKSESASVFSRASKMSSVSKSSKVSKDHVNALGFANDGYDYSQHFREYGGGKFMTKDGKMTTLPAVENIDDDDGRSKLQKSLPDELFESKAIDVDAITISADIMDKDLHDALFAENAEELFEEIDDDFVAQALMGNAEEDPEFDAHLQDLLRESERMVFGGLRDQRGNKFRGFGVGGTINEDEEYYDEEYDGYDGEGDYDDDYNSQDEIYSDEYHEGEGDENGEEDDANYEGFDVPSTLDQKKFNLQFEKALEDEYGDDDIGGLHDEEIEGGEIDLEDNEELDAAMNEFIEQHQSEYNAVMNKSNINKLESENISIVTKAKLKQAIYIERQNNYHEEDIAAKQMLKNKSYLEAQVAEALKAQEEAVELINRIDLEEKSGIIGEEMKKALPYVHKEKIIEEWDCESILSTYSTLENRPTVIRSSSSKFREHKSKFALADEKADQQRQRTMENTESLLKLDRKGLVEKSDGPVAQIVLGGKLGLPKGFEPSHGKAGNTSKGVDNESVNSSSSSSDGNTTKIDTSIGRPKNESKEEKAARKKAAKDEKREKRALKKATKTAYTEESKKLATQNTNTADVTGVPVFRY